MSKPRQQKIITTNSPRETMAVGRQITKILKIGDIIFLYGDLGSGKTVFAKGVCQGLGVKEEVTSSSFVIVTEYTGMMPVSHIDLYRLNSRDVAELSIDEYILDNGITIIEWADRINDNNGLRIKIEIKGKNSREIKIEDLRD